MLSTMNSISMRNGIPKVPGEAMDTVNKDNALKLLYAALRRVAAWP